MEDEPVMSGYPIEETIVEEGALESPMGKKNIGTYSRGNRPEIL